MRTRFADYEPAPSRPRDALACRPAGRPLQRSHPRPRRRSRAGRGPTRRARPWRGARVDGRRVLRQPGPRRRAAIVVAPGGGEPVELTGGAPHTTNNRMEYTAALQRPALAAGGQPRLHRHRLPPAARLDDAVDRGLEAQGMADGGRRPRQEPGPRPGAGLARSPATRRSAGTGCGATRPARSTRTRRSTTAPTASRWPPRAPPPDPGPHAGRAGNPARRRLTARRAGN